MNKITTPYAVYHKDANVWYALHTADRGHTLENFYEYIEKCKKREQFEKELELARKNKHHVIPKHAGGAGLPNNRKLMNIEDHNALHYYDDKVPDDMVLKDEEYYQWMYEYFSKER